MKKNYKSKGFTLIELLIVLGIIILLMVTIYFILDPEKRFAETRNARRWQDITSVLNAVKQYQVDNLGDLPPGFPTDYVVIGNGQNGTYDLLTHLKNSRNLLKMPYDPKFGSQENTCYLVKADGGIVWILAGCAETEYTTGDIELVW